MKYVICTRDAPMALYDQGTLESLGKETLLHMGLMQRTDTLHLLSYLAPVLARGERLCRTSLDNLLLVSGFEKCDIDGNGKGGGHDRMVKAQQYGIVGGLVDSSLSMRGLLPNKVYPSLQIEITLKVVESSNTDHAPTEDSPEYGGGGIALTSDVDTRQLMYCFQSIRFQIIDTHGSI